MDRLAAVVIGSRNVGVNDADAKQKPQVAQNTRRPDLQTNLFSVAAGDCASVLPQVVYVAVFGGQITGLYSGRAGAQVLLVLDHGRLTDASHRWSVGGVGFGVRCGIPIEGCGSLAVDNRRSHGAAHLDGILVSHEAFAGRRAALHIFRLGLHVLVIGVTSADFGGVIALDVSGIVGRLRADGPKPLFDVRRVSGNGDASSTGRGNTI
jgi:hypothetical protein